MRAATAQTANRNFISDVSVCRQKALVQFSFFYSLVDLIFLFLFGLSRRCGRGRRKDETRGMSSTPTKVFFPGQCHLADGSGATGCISVHPVLYNNTVWECMGERAGGRYGPENSGICCRELIAMAGLILEWSQENS